MFEKNKNAFEDLTFEGETDTQAIEESKELIEDETDFHYDRALYAGDDLDEDVDFDDEDLDLHAGDSERQPGSDDEVISLTDGDRTQLTRRSC